MSLEEEGVQIAAQPEENIDIATDESEESSLGIGDRIQIESKLLGQVTGRIYYLDETLLRILPDGVSNRLYDFPITAEGIDPEKQVIEIKVETTSIPSFIEQNRLRVGAIVDTFTAEGDFVSSYIVEEVNIENDSIIIRNRETEEKTEVNFNYTGIPRDLPFAVLRVIPEELIPSEEGPQEDTTEEEVPQDDEDEDEGKAIGFIEIPLMAEVTDIPPAQRIYPESIQKNDLLVDLLSMLDTASQKNPNIIKQLRSFVEITNTLIHQVTTYAADGTPIGRKPASVTQLVELLNSGKVPLSRPVLDVLRVLFIDHTNDHLVRIASGNPGSDSEITNEFFDINFLSDTIRSANNFTDNLTSIGANDVGAPRFYTQLNEFTQEFQQTVRDAGSSVAPKYEAKHDGEFFRKGIPESSEEPATIPGLPVVGGKKKSFFGGGGGPIPLTVDDINSQVHFSLMRLLTANLRRNKDGKYVLAIPADKGTLLSYLLFPMALSNFIGSNRTGSLARDIGRSSMIHKTMAELLEITGSASEIPSANTILNVGLQGNTLGNIDISDYLIDVLKGVEGQFTGFNDFRTILIDLGLDAYELNTETTQVLHERILQDIARVRLLIKTLREEIETTETPVSLASFLDDTSKQTLQDKIVGEPILSETIKELYERTPGLASNDIAIVAYLLKYKQDLTIAALGGQASILEKERLRSQADTYLDTLHAALKSRQLQDNKGLPPIPNKCPHVSALVSIKKIKDDSERTILLAKFVTRYQGSRDENFINCTVCEQHLVCMHEVLQIQQFRHPREQEVLQKELYLSLAGGVFNGRYICRNCGQSIAELDFDKGMGANDAGYAPDGPVDEDALAEEQLQLSLGASVPGTETIEFDNEAKTLCFNIAKEIFGKIGVTPLDSDYRSIIEMAFLRIQTLDSRIDYEKKKKGAEAKGAKGIPDYDTYIKGFSVTTVAALILIDIQTHIPDYVIRYTLPGCMAGFGGFPLQGGADSDKTGINYISCAVGSIVKDEDPWNRTGFLRIRSDAERQKQIARFMEGIIQKILQTEPTVLQRIAVKQEYRRETLGAEAADGRPRDKIPGDFRPLQEIISGIKDADNTEPVVPEAINTKNPAGLRKLAAAWIRDSHRHALRTAQLIRGNPFAETACCFSKITTPGAYWAEQKDQIPLQRVRPPFSPLYRSSLIFVHFKPKAMHELIAEAPLNLAFRIFLKICYTGPRKGFAHELGYNGVCDNCGLKLSSAYLFPDYSVQTRSKASEPIIDTGVLISDLQAQGVDVTPEFFQDLLDTTHRNYIVPGTKYMKVTPATELLQRLGNLMPPPMGKWRENLADLITRLTSLTNDASETEVALAYGTFSDTVGDSEEFVRRRLGQAGAGTLNKWLSKDSFTLKEIIISYLIVPLQRALNSYNTEMLRVSPLYNLGGEHMASLHTMLDAHVSINKKYQSSLKEGIAAAKIQYFLTQIQGYLEFASELQSGRTPGGAIGVKYLKYALFLGPFAELLDLNRAPPGAGGEVATTSLVDKSGTILTAFINGCMAQFEGESLSYSPDEIRLRIAKAAEKEKMNFIGDLDKMDDDGKQVELVNKALGIGRWSIGGSKLIFAYNADQWERERDERIRRGENDLYPGQDTAPPGNNNVLNLFGGGGEGADTFYEAQGGYDVQQEGSDDF